MIRFHHMSFSYDNGVRIFQDVNLEIDTRWNLGLVGRNGRGKTTLLSIIRGQLPCEGEFFIDCPCDAFPYDMTDEMMWLPLAEFYDRWKPTAEFWKIQRESSLLEIADNLLFVPFSRLSPGEQTKLMLAVLFSGENDFLLIDEPTNHLDEDTRSIVANYLKQKHGYILVSHERDLLDACTDHILAINQKSVELQKGNFSSWYENRQRINAFEEAQNERYRAEIRQLKESARRANVWAQKNENTKIGFDPIREPDRNKDTRAIIGAKTKKMHRRAGQLTRRIEKSIEEKQSLLLETETAPRLQINLLHTPHKRLITVRGLRLRYRDGDPLFAPLDFEVSEGDVLAFRGRNGAGKSTLLRYLRSAAPDVLASGDLTVAPGLQIAWLPQQTDHLRGGILTFCEALNVDPSLFFAVLTKLGFEEKSFETPLEQLSEGERKKILLAANLCTPAHLFLWDEPLNYVDVFTRMQLEELIREKHPTLLLVEHDSVFCRNIHAQTIFLQ